MVTGVTKRREGGNKFKLLSKFKNIKSDKILNIFKRNTKEQKSK